jgi:hypothetical protein
VGLLREGGREGGERRKKSKEWKRKGNAILNNSLWSSFLSFLG